MAEYQRKPNTTCTECKKPIYRRPAEIKQKVLGAFCSQACYGKAQRKEHPCKICGCLILASANKKTCSRICANKNRAGMKYLGRSKKDKVKSYRQLRERLFRIRPKKCERCGFSIYKILQIHHRDRDRNNNELNNLELLCPNCHAMEHYLKN